MFEESTKKTPIWPAPIAGVVLGAALGFVFAPPPRPDVPDCVSKADKEGRLEQRLAALPDDQREDLELLFREGERSPWPEGSDRVATRKAVKTALADVVGKKGRVALVECDEYPCVAAVVGPANTAWRMKVEQGLTDAGYLLKPPGRAALLPEPKVTVYGLTIADGPLPPPVSIRARHRARIAFFDTDSTLRDAKMRWK